MSPRGTNQSATKRTAAQQFGKCSPDVALEANPLIGHLGESNGIVYILRQITTATHTKSRRCNKTAYAAASCWRNLTRNECASGCRRPATISKHHQPRCASLHSRCAAQTHSRSLHSFSASISPSLSHSDTFNLWLPQVARASALALTQIHRHTCLPHDMIGEGQACSYDMPRSMMHNRTRWPTPPARVCATFLRRSKWNGI